MKILRYFFEKPVMFYPAFQMHVGMTGPTEGRCWKAFVNGYLEKTDGDFTPHPAFQVESVSVGVIKKRIGCNPGGGIIG